MSEQHPDSTGGSEAARGAGGKGSALWWWAAGVVTLLVVVVAAWALWRTFGRVKVWTDDRDIAVPDGRAEIRRVLWSPPRAVPGKLNTPEQEYEPALSPDGSELYFVRGLPGRGADIYVSYRRNNAWADPVAVAAVNTDHDELGPRLTPDGRYLFFYSDRPGGQGMHDLWAAARTEGGWGRPFNLGPAVNSRWNEYGAAFDPAGRLYFATNRNAAEKKAHKEWRATIRQSEIGDYDLFVCDPGPRARTRPTTAPATGPATRPAALAFGPARELTGVNTPHHEGACCVSPTGDFLYFASNRPGGHGRFDLYRCRLRDGSARLVENLGGGINTAADEADPQLALGGFQLYFSSDRNGEAARSDLFVSDSREVYAHLIRRRGPQVSWHVWAFLIAAGVLIPLLLFLKAGGYRHLSLLQKCAFVSLLVHALMVFLFTVFPLSWHFLKFVAEEAGMTVAVNLDLAREVEIGQEVRDQIAKLPVAEPDVADLARVDQVEVPRVAPEPPKLNIPRVRHQPSPMTVQPEAPPVTPPEPTERLSLPEPKLKAETPEIDLAPPRPIVETEDRPEPETPRPRAMEARRVERRAEAEAIDLAVERARVEAESLAAAAEAQRPTPAPSEPIRPEVAPPTPTAVDVKAPEVKAAPVAERPPEEPAVTEAPVRLARAAAPAESVAAPREIALTPARAAVERKSLAQATEARRPTPTLTETPPERPAPPKAPSVNVTGPQIESAPVASRQPEEPAMAEASVSSERVEPARRPSGRPTEVALAAERARIETRSLAAAAEARPAQPAPAERPPAPEVELPEQPRLEVAGPDVQASPVTAEGEDRPALPEAPVEVARTQATPPRAGRPAEVALRPERAQVRTSSLLRASEARATATAAVAQPAPTARPRPQAVAVTGPEVVSAPVAGEAAEQPVVAEAAATTTRRPVGSTQIGRPSEIELSAGRATVATQSIARPAARRRPAAARAEPVVRLTHTAKPEAVKVTGPNLAAAPVAGEVVEQPAPAEATVRAPRARAAGRATGRPSEIALSAAPAATAGGSLARAAAPPRRAKVVEELTPEVPAARTMVEVTGPQTSAAPVVAGRPSPMTVSEPSVRADRTRIAGPRGQASPATIGLPATEAVRRSTVVAASASPRRSTSQKPVALDLPTRAGAVEVRLPVLAGRDRLDAQEQPLIATAVRSPRAMRPRAISAFGPETPSGPAPTVQQIAPTSATEASMVRQPLGETRRPRKSEAVADRALPEAPLVELSGNLGPGKLTAPEALAQRSFEQRQRLLNEMGGTKESEAGVSRALVYLARNQEANGRWTHVDGRRSRRRHQVDTAVTGLAALSFLAADHTPDKPGPYRKTVAKAVDYLISQQKPDGDLRGHGRMYGHAIATLAIAEAAAMTGNERYRQAAIKGAQFIIKAQHKRTGGWRYSPGDTGDTSVFGWQVMALRSVENLGVKIPDKTRKLAFHWLNKVSAGKHKMLAGYTGRQPKPAMVAEAMFSRLLLRQKLTEAEQKEACDYLLKHMPGKGETNYYYWYYASLALAQLRNDPWTKWNARMRAHLLKLQKRSGRADGSWDTRSTYGSRGGRVYTTAMAALTLEVYYRYLPMYRTEPPPKEKKPAPAPREPFD